MPEALEAEIWRRASIVLVGRTIDQVWVDQRIAPDGFVDRLLGRRICDIRRAGKVLLVDTDGPTVGIHLGMTGRLVIDGRSPIERLEYASGADRASWDRLRLRTIPGADERCALRMNDPRRLGRVSLDADLSALGPDAFTLTASELADQLTGRRAAIKSLLLDQSVVAGLGNLCADEVLFWAEVSPRRPADRLSDDDVERIASASRERLPIMLAAGGSTHGSLDPVHRAAPGACPLDGAPLERSTIGGRTAVWCPSHQR